MNNAMPVFPLICWASTVTPWCSVPGVDTLLGRIARHGASLVWARRRGSGTANHNGVTFPVQTGTEATVFKNIDNSKYAWLAGWVHKLKAGEALIATRGHTDREGFFTCTPQSFSGVVYSMAAFKGWKATVVTTDTQVAFAFYKANDYMRPNMPACPVVKKMKGELHR